MPEFGRIKLSPDIPPTDFTRSDFLRATQSLTVQELTVFANLIAPMATAARTDAGADGEVAFYTSGADIRLQVYSTDLGAWKEVTLS